MPDTLSREELAELRERSRVDALGIADDSPEEDRRALIAHIDALTAERDAWRKSAEEAFAELRQYRDS